MQRELFFLLWMFVLIPTCARAGTTPHASSTTQHKHVAPVSHKTAAPRLVRVSWYGPGFQGKKMADGNRFDRKNPTLAAHKSLPFGTRVRITTIPTVQSIEVVITDRGPYEPGREIDLSEAAAESLGIIEAGVVTVQMEILP